MASHNNSVNATQLELSSRKKINFYEEVSNESQKIMTTKTFMTTKK